MEALDEDEDAAEAFYDEAAYQFAVLTNMVEGKCLLTGEPTPGRCIVEQRRWPAVVAMVLTKTPAPLRPRLVQALADGHDRDPVSARLAAWVRQLIWLAARLPADVSEATVGRVVTEVIDAANLADPFHYPCRACGLARPRRPGGVCLHCGHTEVGHPDTPGDWQRLAEEELDPDCPERSNHHERPRCGPRPRP